MRKNAIRAVLSLMLLSAPAVQAQDAAVYKLPPPRITCDAASGVLDPSGHVVEGSLHKRCEALWTRSVQDGGVGQWRHDDFMGQCAQSCAAPIPLSQASSVPELNALGTQAAAGANGGGGYTTALYVGGGIAAAIGIGLAVSSSDKPASP